MKKTSHLLIVDHNGSKGSVQTIQKAVETAGPGDTVLVKPGIYREHVALVRGGEKGQPLTVKAETPGTVFVRGSEVWNPNWTKSDTDDGVYSAPLPWDLFTSESNPFRVKLCVWSQDKKEDSRPSDRSMLMPYSTDYPAVDGVLRRSVPQGCTLPPPPPPPADRFKEPWPAAHDRPIGDPSKLLPYSLGQLFYNGRELPQSQTESEVRRVPGSWILSIDGEQILLHFPTGGKPNDGKLEITVRDRVFSPARRGLEYIHLSGFVFEHCGNQGPFPQNGMVSIRSGSNWVIENNIIRHAKTLGLDCGSEYWKYDQIAYTVPEDYVDFKPRNVTIRNNVFSNNGLSAITGHINIDFVIENNIIENNNTLSLANDYECEWEEQGAIKLHGSNRTIIRNNLIRNNAAHGIWIDCGHDDSRISRNFVYGNEGNAIYMEVGSHGVVIDNNIVACSHPFFPQDGHGRGAGYAISHASNVTFAHNLVVDNYGPGISAGHDVPRGDSKMTGHTFLNNIFLRNHGCIEVPPDNDVAFDNSSDSNVFVNTGAFHFFSALYKQDPSKLKEYALSRLTDPTDREAVERAPANTFTPELWTKITGMEKNSIYLNELNFNCKIKPYEPSIRIRADFAKTLLAAKCRLVPGVEEDFEGNKINPDRVLPGPFQSLQEGDNYYILFTLSAGI